MAVSTASLPPLTGYTRGSSTGRCRASSAAYVSTASVVNWVAWTYETLAACSLNARRISRSPCPTLTTTAPPPPSRYRFPSASVIQQPSAETACGSPLVARGKTRPAVIALRDRQRCQSVRSRTETAPRRRLPSRRGRASVLTTRSADGLNRIDVAPSRLRVLAVQEPGDPQDAAPDG